MRKKPGYSGKSKRSEQTPDETAIIKDAPAPSEERLPPSSRRLTPATALAELRVRLGEMAQQPPIKSVLDRIERAIAGEPKEGDEPHADDDDEPTTSRTGPPSALREDEEEPPPPLSRFAIRDDFAVLLSVDDMTDRELEGRELQTFFVLTPEERARARDIADGGISSAAAQLIASFPKRPA